MPARLSRRLPRHDASHQIRHRFLGSFRRTLPRRGFATLTRRWLTRLRHLLPHGVDERIDVIVIAVQIGRVILALSQAQRRPLGDDIDDLWRSGRIADYPVHIGRWIVWP